MELPSYLKLYVAYWLTLVASAIIGRLTLFPALSSDSRSLLAIGYLFLSSVPATVVNVMSHLRLLEYLQKYYPSTWQELTYVPVFGNSGINGWRLLKFVYSADDLGDPTVRFLKEQHKACTAILLVVFVSLLPMAAVVAV